MRPEPDDRDLIRRFQAGDRDAFTALYRMQYPAVFRFAFHMTGNRVKAGEIAQDVFVWLIQHTSDFDPTRGELGAFLIGVTRKFLQRHYRVEQKFIPLDTSLAETPAQFHSETEESNAAELRRAIAALPMHYREAVVLCDLEERSYEQAAEALDCAVGTVRSRLHRARELLARKIRLQQRCSV